MLTGLGFTPFYAGAICLLANSAAVAFGSIGIPVVTLAGITGLPLERVSAAVGCLCAPVSPIIPAYLTNAMGGPRALKAVWPAALVAGASFAGVQFIVSNFIEAQLTDTLSSPAAIAALVTLLHFWKPAAQFQGFTGAGAVAVPANPEQVRKPPRARSFSGATGTLGLAFASTGALSPSSVRCSAGSCSFTAIIWSWSRAARRRSP
jgi:L-lactate permease